MSVLHDVWSLSWTVLNAGETKMARELNYGVVSSLVCLAPWQECFENWDELGSSTRIRGMGCKTVHS